MWFQQMVVHEDASVRDQAAKALQRALGRPDALVLRAANFQEASAYLTEAGREWSLIVVGTNAPENALSPIAPGNTAAARAFIRSVRRARAIPLVAMSTVEDPEIDDLLSNWEQTASIPLDFNGLETSARALLDNSPIDSSLELEITLKDQEHGFWRVQRRGLQGLSDKGPLKIDPDVFSDLVDLSRALGKCDDTEWEESLKNVAKKLAKLLFDSENLKMVKAFFGNLHSVGGIENSQILFTMTPQGQKAMVEALREHADDPVQDSLILKLPIVRQYEISGGLSPLFTDRQSRSGKVNCLIVNADPAAGTLEHAPDEGRLDCLEQAAVEACDITRFLQNAAQGDPGIGVVEALDLSNDPADAFGRLTRKLKERTWHIVHFAGHGVLDPQTKTPALVLSARHKVVVKFTDLVGALGETRFLFLSACRSAGPEFINKAIAHSVPMVLGYQWKVVDSEAYEFAKSFYQYLFTVGPTYKSVHRALVAARLAALKLNPDGRTWASPVLLTQARQERAA